MSSRTINFIIVMVVVVAAAGAWITYVHSQNAVKKTLIDKYARVQLPTMLNLDTARATWSPGLFRPGHWTYHYQPSADRATVYVGVSAALKAAGYNVSGQHNEFIVATDAADHLSVSGTLNPVDNSPLQSLDMVVENTP